MVTGEIEARLEHVFAAAGCDGYLCVRELGSERTIAVNADEAVVSASVFKVLVALTFFTLAATGEIDPAERVHVDPRTSLGAPSGLSIFEDEVEVTLRDLVKSMLTVSDMIATDIVMEHVGIDSINDVATSLGLPRTVVATNVMTMFESLARDVGFVSWKALASHQWQGEEVEPALERMRTAAVCDSTNPQATVTTARETAQLLALIWRDEAGPADACASVRTLMGKQLQRERIARAFKNDPDIRFSGKTGTFGGRFRNEAGVFEFPNGDCYVIAIFTSGHALYTRPLDIDDAIGDAARLAVETLQCC